MKLLIAYTSKNGVAKRCAEMLEKTLSKTANIDVVDLLVNTPDPSEYDAVVLGGSIRFGSFNKKLKVFLKNNKEIPLRVTHNDTKLNNIMLDVRTGKGI